MTSISLALVRFSVSLGSAATVSLRHRPTVVLIQIDRFREKGPEAVGKIIIPTEEHREAAIPAHDLHLGKWMLDRDLG
jgi:hypothetical protein